ncbi:MAG TPA: hypothetical protein VJ976_02390 [Ornithinimicrobium sp.]|uniref:hypothetical protein n=1 Tax=Ornithinimicrobium sp. TaxID=1977084 RepID=UPI002B482B7D|nr:hypothetical protein [Ornithinimicrobium sp.]HKJ11219.1 hypothetical protein [Ornithinimicrobium sp.]
MIVIDHSGPDLRVVGRRPDVSEHRARAQARDDTLEVVVVERGYLPAVDERLVRLEEVLAPRAEPPPGQLQLGVPLGVESVVDQAVRGREQQMFQRVSGLLTS